MFKLDLEKAEEPEIKLPISVRSQKKQQCFRKTSTSALLTVFHNKQWKIIQEMGIPDPPNLPPDKSVWKSRSNC